MELIGRKEGRRSWPGGLVGHVLLLKWQGEEEEHCSGGRAGMAIGKLGSDGSVVRACLRVGVAVLEARS